MGSIKTIQEREAAYAKARERILGKDYENDEEIESDKRNSLNQASSNQSSVVRQPNAPNLNSNFANRK